MSLWKTQQNGKRWNQRPVKRLAKGEEKVEIARKKDVQETLTRI